MNDGDCVAFLQWALPRLGLRWEGYRRVRRQVCKRIARRLAALGLPDLAAYRRRLENDPGEWRVLDALTPITITRFYRDRVVFEALEREVLPELACEALRRGARELRCWSAGCAGGEEAYTLSIAWTLGVGPLFPGIAIEIVATDVDERLLARAAKGCYSPASLRELPAAWKDLAFVTTRDGLCVRDEYRRGVEFLRQDLRAAQPQGMFDLILCRNLAFTYFNEKLQRSVLDTITARLEPGGALAIGAHEKLPQPAAGFEPWPGQRGLFRRVR